MTVTLHLDDAVAEALAAEAARRGQPADELAAAADRADKDHEACRQLLESDEGPMVTTAIVITEASIH